MMVGRMGRLLALGKKPRILKRELPSGPAAFGACRFIVMKSLPGWMDEICTEHLQAV